MTENGNWREELSRVFIHNTLVEEMRIRKEDYEKKLGYKLDGGTPVISNICAEILKRQRLGSKDKIIIEFHKIKGKKKNSIIIL